VTTPRGAPQSAASIRLEASRVPGAGRPSSAAGAQAALAGIEGPEARAWALARTAAAKAESKTLTLLIPTGSIGNMTPHVDL
jgi:hypothetical protein